MSEEPALQEERAALAIMHFADAATLEAWLEVAPIDHPGIWLKLAKKGQGVTSVSQREAVDAGLCFGWIDGLINRYDERFYLLRYTPRRPRSKWSLVNTERAAALVKANRVRPGGMRQIEAAKADGRWDAAYPPSSRMEVPADFQAAVEASLDAKTFFANLKAASRYAILYRLHHVQGEARRSRAIAEWVAKLARGEAP